MREKNFIKLLSWSIEKDNFGSEYKEVDKGIDNSIIAVKLKKAKNINDNFTDIKLKIHPDNSFNDKYFKIPKSNGFIITYKNSNENEIVFCMVQNDIYFYYILPPSKDWITKFVKINDMKNENSLKPDLNNIACFTFSFHYYTKEEISDTLYIKEFFIDNYEIDLKKPKNIISERLKINKNLSKKIYIGLSVYLHDPSIAIIDYNGDILYAEATERFLQNKRAWNSIPDNFMFIDKLLNKFCKDCDEVIICFSWSKSYMDFLKKHPKPVMVFQNGGFIEKNENSFMPVIGYGEAFHMTGHNLKYVLQNINPKIKIKVKYYNHHLTHAATACFGSPFNEALCAVVDGYGEWTSTMFFHYNNGKIKKLKKSKLSSGSLGMYYATLCSVCGFDSIKGEEWKVMGLAPYGVYDENIYDKLKQVLKVNKLQLVNGNKAKDVWKYLYKNMQRAYNESPLKSANLAFTGQKYFSDLMIQLLNNLYNEMQITNLVLSGGCALNSAWNGQMIENTPFKNLYIPSAPGDDGNSIGAALLAYAEDNPEFNPNKSIFSPYLGESMSASTIKRIDKFSNMKNHLKKGEDIYKKTAELLADGNIIGWVQGKGEFGPRALGNRSILADPRDPDIKEKINASVKFREEFRPFAPSILHEHGEEYFENYQESPYMERTLKFRKEVIDKVPGVVHVDNTGRLQSVKEEWNNKYYRLIKEFYNITGIPLLLNTSFNIMGKPIIHTVEDAIALFHTTGMNVLVIEDQLFIK